MKPGPKEVAAGSLYVFAHQAYWGFRFLREKRKVLWSRIQSSESIATIRRIGIYCALPETMRGATHGAAGAMTWLEDENVARQILAARHHRRYPNSERPTSEDRRMIFLGIAVAAGVFGQSLSTALRKLAESNLGIDEIAWDVHAIDRLREMATANAFVWAEPVGNYFCSLGEGTSLLLRDLPCELPTNWQGGGYFVYVQQAGGSRAVFSYTLPTELNDSPSPPNDPHQQPAVVLPAQPPKTIAENHVVCECGATVAASDRKTALKALAEHKRDVHGINRQS